MDEIRLTQDEIGGAPIGVSTQTIGGEVQHPVVVRVRNIDAPIPIKSKSMWVLKLGLARPAYAGLEVGLANDQIGGTPIGVSTQTIGGEVQHPIVLRIGNKEASSAVHDNA